jgi:hypothetical protein
VRVRYTAAFCKTCGKPVWLPHREHEGDLVVRYDAGRRPLLRLRRPQPPAMTAIKRYRTDLARRAASDNDLRHAASMLEELLPYVGRASADPSERRADHVLLGMLGETLYRQGEVEKALAVIERADLAPRHLDEGRRLCLAVRALCYVSLRMPQAARADRDRLYAQDPQHPLMGEIERALETEGIPPSVQQTTDGVRAQSV